MVNLDATSTATATNLDNFFAFIDSLNSSLQSLELLHRRLSSTLAALHTAGPTTIPKLRASIDADLTDALVTSKLIRVRLDSLDQANAANRSFPGCGAGSSTDRTRTGVVDGVRRSLRVSWETFSELRRRAVEERREAVGRLYFAVSGERADEGKVDALMEKGEGEGLIRRAIEEGRVDEVMAGVEERWEAAEEIERRLVKLQQVFVDMRLLVEGQGMGLDDIEGNVGKASSFVREGVEELEGAREEQKKRRCWIWIVALVLVCVAVVIVLTIVLRSVNQKTLVLLSDI